MVFIPLIHYFLVCFSMVFTVFSRMDFGGKEVKKPVKGKLEAKFAQTSHEFWIIALHIT